MTIGQDEFRNFAEIIFEMAESGIVNSKEEFGRLMTAAHHPESRCDVHIIDGETAQKAIAEAGLERYVKAGEILAYYLAGEAVTWSKGGPAIVGCLVIGSDGKRLLISETKHWPEEVKGQISRLFDKLMRAEGVLPEDVDDTEYLSLDYDADGNRRVDARFNKNIRSKAKIDEEVSKFSDELDRLLPTKKGGEHGQGPDS